MTPSHATKSGKRYRYYITRSDQFDDKPAWRVSGYDLERLVCDRLCELLTDKQSLCDLASDAPANVFQNLLARANLAATTLRSGPAADRAVLLTGSITRIDLKETAIDLTIDPACLFKILAMDASVEVTTRSLLLTLAAMRIRRGHQIRLVIPGPQVFNSNRASRDEKLVTLIAEAHQARQILLAHPDRSIAAIAATRGRCRTRLGKLAALACLAPNIVSAIVEGRQPLTLTARTLQEIDLPLAWPDQRALLGFA